MRPQTLFELPAICRAMSAAAMGCLEDPGHSVIAPQASLERYKKHSIIYMYHLGYNPI